MRNNFINFKRKKITKTYRMLYLNRPHKYYQLSKTGSFIMVVKKGVKIKLNQVAPLIKIARKHIKKRSILTLSSSLDSFFTSKPLGVRMGKGKGKVDSSLLVARSGQPLLSLSEVKIVRASKLYKFLRFRQPLLRLVDKSF